MERVAFEANRTEKSPNPEAVHDLRVAIRRLQQGLITFKALFPRKTAKRIRKQLKEVLSAAGNLRNCDIALGILSEKKGLSTAGLIRHVEELRRRAQKSLLQILASLSLRTRVSKWCRHLHMDSPHAGFGAEDLQTMGRAILPQLAQRFFRAGDAAAFHGSAGKLHAFRILAKKFRYTMELFSSVYGSAGEQCLGEIKAVQGILGRVNDYRTVLSMASETGSGNKLKEALRRAERRKIRQFRETWAKEFSSSVAAGWLRTLRGRPVPRRAVQKALTAARDAGANLAAATA